MPDALFLGWVDKKYIAQLYLSLDLFIFPSQFDTFGNVILESFVYGMPVVAYNCKGPKDIIENNINGYLVDNIEQMRQQITNYFINTEQKRTLMQKNATRRAGEYQAKPIMEKFIKDMGLVVPDININASVKYRSVA
jgi:glycosyltransferase involved in cell wall biosynthesis